MPGPLLLLPDFLLILIGWCVCRWTALDRPIWQSAERLVYYLLFPVLLFNSTLTSPLHPSQAVFIAAAALGTVGCGIALAFALKRWPGVDPGLHAAGAQVAFRFNSFIALALADRLGGQLAVARMALMIALCVPVCNVAAVWMLAKHGGHHWGRELMRNPLIVSTLAGLLGNAIGLHFPEAVQTTLQRIGVAALPVGLMAAGAGLKLGAIRAAPGLAAALLGLRHLVLPAIALGLVGWLALPADQRAIVIVFAALPTSAATYVLAARMGSHGGFVAGLVTLSTLFGMLSVPLWLALQAR